ncbi:MAG: glycosyl transferase family 1, partial [Actinomycetota bacterium]
MAAIQSIEIAPLDPERFGSVLGEAYAEFAEAIVAGQKLFENRVIWNVNSTGKGGGVAEMLRSLIAYARGGGVDARWVVISGNPDFFRVTKRIHNHLHGATGDGGALGSSEKEIYERTLAPNADELGKLVSPGDVVILHDPQTAGLCRAMKEAGATVLWRCHVGLDDPNETAGAAWGFLRPFLTSADSYIFSRRAFVWDDLADDKIEIIPPSIDAFSPKNQDMTEAEVDAVLAAAGVTSGGRTGEPTFKRIDGSEG